MDCITHWRLGKLRFLWTVWGLEVGYHQCNLWKGEEWYWFICLRQCYERMSNCHHSKWPRTCWLSLQVQCRLSRKSVRQERLSRYTSLLLVHRPHFILLWNPNLTLIIFETTLWYILEVKIREYITNRIC